MNFMILSNIMMLFPIIVSAYQGRFFFCVYAIITGLASVFYHYLKIYKPLSALLPFARFLDWSLVITGSAYLLYFIYKSHHNYHHLKIWLLLLFVFSLLFFWYGYMLGDYEKFHPFFHIIGQGVIGLIVLLL
jgi:hypothetical protein